MVDSRSTQPNRSNLQKTIGMMLTELECTFDSGTRPQKLCNQPDTCGQTVRCKRQLKIAAGGPLKSAAGSLG